MNQQTKIFKITFSDGDTWYGQKHDRKDAKSFLNYLLSNTKNDHKSTHNNLLNKKINNTVNKNNIQCEIVWEGDRSESNSILESFIKSDQNSINKLKSGKPQTNFNIKPISIPKEELFKTPSGIYINKMYLSIKPELKSRINIKDYINKGTSVFYKINDEKKINIIESIYQNNEANELVRKIQDLLNNYPNGLVYYNTDILSVTVELLNNLEIVFLDLDSKSNNNNSSGSFTPLINKKYVIYIYSCYIELKDKSLFVSYNKPTLIKGLNHYIQKIKT
jgi:hypothetical protein